MFCSNFNHDTDSSWILRFYSVPPDSYLHHALNFAITSFNLYFNSLFAIIQSFGGFAYTTFVHKVLILIPYLGLGKFWAIPEKGSCKWTCSVSKLYGQSLYIYYYILCYIIYYYIKAARGSIVGLGAMLQAEWSQVRDHMRSLIFFNLPNPSGRIRPWGLLSL
jgi:hypothetical protein